MLQFVLRSFSATSSGVAPARLKYHLTNTLAFLIWSCAIFALPGHAQPVNKAVVNTPQLRAELLAHAPQGVQPGQPLWVGLQLTHQPDWHSYWSNPGDSGLPTQMEFNLPPGITAGDVQWPLPHKLKAGNLTNYGFEKTVLLAVPLTVSSRFKANATQMLNIQLHANWLVCRLECIPQEGDFALNIPVNSSFAPQAAAFAELADQQPKVLDNAKCDISFDAQRLVMHVSGLPTKLQGKSLAVYPELAELVDSATDQHPAASQTWQNDAWTIKLPLSTMRVNEPKSFNALLILEDSGERQGFWISGPVTKPWPSILEQPSTSVQASSTSMIDTSSLGFGLALIAAFVGGLTLNLMPCVLPVLAIKLLGFAQHSRAHHAHRVAGMAYTVGVVMSFIALGFVVIALRAAGEQLGWGFQLQSPAVVSILAAFFMLIALNFLGLFEFSQFLPSRLASFQYKHPVIDALLSGILAVAVASPCTAPFMGASLGLAMTLPTWQALTIFTTMGLGLASPYLLASFLPAVARLLPHPGPWMISLRQLLAFPMLATVVWLLWVLGQQTSLDTTMFALGGLLLLAAFIWTLKQHFLLMRLLAWLIALVLAWGSFDFANELNTSTNVAMNNINAINASSNTTWHAWSEAAVTENLAQGHPVFVDFTAAWCVTCQINKKSTLSNSAVLDDFVSHRVTLMRADWTRRDPNITSTLKSLGRSGVPVYVLYTPGRAPQVLSELLSVNKIHEALNILPTPIKSQ